MGSRLGLSPQCPTVLGRASGAKAEEPRGAAAPTSQPWAPRQVRAELVPAPLAAAAPPPTGWAGLGAATTPRRLSLAPAPLSSVTEGSHNCPVSVPLGPQAVQWLYSCRTQPFLCPFLAVVQICLNLEGALLALQQPGRECWSLAPRAQLQPLVQPHQSCLWMWVVPGVSSA